jgi:hypothetical protein
MSLGACPFQIHPSEHMHYFLPLCFIQDIKILINAFCAKVQLTIIGWEQVPMSLKGLTVTSCYITFTCIHILCGSLYIRAKLAVYVAIRSGMMPPMHSHINRLLVIWTVYVKDNITRYESFIMDEEYTFCTFYAYPMPSYNIFDNRKCEMGLFSYGVWTAIQRWKKC